MNDGQKKYTLLWVPTNGLFYRNGTFYDGENNPIKVETITLWDSEKDALEASARIYEAHRRRYRTGNLVMLGLTMKEVHRANQT